MAYNRNKSLAKAQKLLQKGKIEEAIEEYLLVVENDPADVRTLLKVGDLQAKLGNIDAATDTYRKVGEHYAKDGFFLKAVAVFKQILKLDPGLIRVYARLAELYQHLGLSSEAMKQYQIVVRHYENQGLKKESLDILKKMSELEPDNTASKLKLAELYAKEGHSEESTQQFRQVAEELKKRNNLQDLARVYEKMETVGILEDAQRLELVEVFLDIAEPKRALSKLQVLFQKDPKNLRVLELLARAFTDLQQPEKAKSVYTEIINLANERGLLEERDHFTAKLRALGVISSSQPVVDGVPKAPAAPPPKAAPPAPEEAAKKRSSMLQKPVERVLEEVNVFMQYGLLEKACTALSEAVVSLPANEAVRRKLMEAYRQIGDLAALEAALQKSLEAAEALQLTEAVSAIRKEMALIVERPVEEGAPGSASKVDLDLSEVGIVDDGSAASSPAESELEVSLEGSAGDGERSEPSERTFLEPKRISKKEEKEPEVPAELAAEMELPELEGGSKAEPVPFDLDAEFSREEPALSVPPEPVSAKPEEKIVLELSPEVEVKAPPPVIAVEPPPQAEVEAVEPIVLEEVAPEGETIPEADEFASDMEEASFFANQGLLEEAEEVYQDILARNKDYRPAVLKLAEFKDSRPAMPAVRSNMEPERRSAPRAKRAGVPPEPLEPPKPKEAPRVFAESDAFFDLSEELQDEIRDLEGELSKRKSPDEEDYLSPEEVISEFKKGISRTVSKDDYQTHYNLGIAYKEMGLLDEAIHEFQIAGKEENRTADCASMIGLCLIAKKEFPAAINVYRKALAQISPQSPEALGLSYELAEAYIGNGSVSEAYKLFARVADVDPTFRDCRRRAKELELDLGRSAPHPSAPEKPEKPEAEEKSVVKIPGKKNKISYI